MGLMWQEFGSTGSAGVASVSSCQKLLPCLTEPTAASSEPTSNGITDLRRGKQTAQMALRASEERSERRSERSNPADTEVSKQGEAGGVGRAEVPLQPMERQLRPWRFTCWSRWMPQGGWPCTGAGSCGTCGAMERETHAGDGWLAGFVIPWGYTLEQPVPEGLNPVEETNAGAICGESYAVGRTCVWEVWRELSPVGVTPCWNRVSVWGVLPLRMKEQGRQWVMNWLQPPFPVALHPWQGGDRDLWVKSGLERKDSWGKMLGWVSFLITLFWINW